MSDGALGHSDLGGSHRVPPRRIWKHALPTALLFVALAIAAYAIHRELRSISLGDVAAGLSAIPTRAILASLAFTAMSYVTLVGYDASAFRYLGIRTPVWRLVMGSFCGYAIANTAGFALLTGATARYRIHSAGGLTLFDAGRIALFSAFAFGAGVSLIGALGLLIAPGSVAGLVGLPVSGVQLIATLMLGAIASLLVVSARGGTVKFGRFSFTPPTFRLTLVQLALSILDILFSGAALYVLMPAQAEIAFSEFLPVYCAALAAGILSHVPGGVGVFDAVILASYSWRVAPGGVIAALLTFRLIYFLLPFILALLVLAITELSRHGARATRRLGKYADIADALAPLLGTSVALAAAILLLVSGAVPGLLFTRPSSLAFYLPVSVIEAAHFLSSVVASALMFLTFGLMRRLNAAYWLVITLMVIAAALALLKGFAYGEGLAYLGFALVLLPFRDAFTRSTRFVDQPLTPAWVASFAALLLAAGYVTFFAFEENAFHAGLWFEFALERDAPRAARALIGASVTALILATAFLMRRPGQTEPAPPLPEELERAARIVAEQDQASANLVHLVDKALLFSDSGRAFVMYGEHDRNWIAFGDPIGPEQERRELVWRFREAAYRARARPAFHQVSSGNLPAYVDAGFHLLKISEEARVGLSGFHLQGKERHNLRVALRRADREGMTFELLPPGAVTSLLPVLESISADWLCTRGARECGCALGRFEPSYVLRFDIALVRAAGRPVAFATVLRTRLKKEAAIDLFRHVSDASPATLTFLTTRLMLTLKERGLQEFSLGLVPATGTENEPQLGPFHRLDALLELHGSFHRHKGLRTFKEQFGPVWVPRYLAYTGDRDPVATLEAAAILIAGPEAVAAASQ